MGFEFAHNLAGMACEQGNCPAEDDPDPTACGCPPCPNARLCGVHHIPAVYLDIHRGTCGNCAASFGRPLAFVERESDCAICLQATPVQVEHPAKCGHHFCVDCTRTMIWPSGAEAVSPGDYGWDGNLSDEEQWSQWLQTQAGRRYESECDRAEEAKERRRDKKCPLCRRIGAPDWASKVGRWAE